MPIISESPAVAQSPTKDTPSWCVSDFKLTTSGKAAEITITHGPTVLTILRNEAGAITAATAEAQYLNHVFGIDPKDALLNLLIEAVEVPGVSTPQTVYKK